MIAYLSSLNDEAFADVVDGDIREKTAPAIHDALRSPELFHRWRACLIKMKKDIEWQMTNHSAAKTEWKAKCFFGDNPLGRDAWVEWLAERERWRANTLRVLKSIEGCLTEATAIEKGFENVNV